MKKQLLAVLLALGIGFAVPQTVSAADTEDTDPGNIGVLQDYLLCRADTLPNGLDLNADGEIDVFDLALMKRIKKADTLEPKATVHTGDATF